MRIVSKIISAMLFCSIFLSSCGGITAIPPSLEVSTSTALTPNTITVTPIPSPTITPTEPPPPNASDYRLLPWNGDDTYYSSLATKASKDFYVGFNNDKLAYGLVFQAENLLRNPSSNWRDVAWQIVANNPKGISLPGMHSNEDLLAFLIEDLLNNQGIKLDNLFNVLKDKKLDTLKCFRAEIVESPSKQGDYLLVNNLFGDKQDAWIFYVGNCLVDAIYSLRKVDNQYQVVKLRDWQELEIPAAGFKLLLDTVGDVNNNNTPELVVDVLFGASGTPPGRRETIEFYEWNTSEGAFDTDNIEMKENVCYMYQPCENGWRVEKANPQGFHPVVINEQYATMYKDIDETPSCDNFIVEHTYLWKNAKFVEQKRSVLPPTDKRVECQLSWALQDLKRSVGENIIATTLISKALTHWPDVMNDVWGPASRDYFALRLGLAYDMTGQEKPALALIQDIAEHPSTANYQFASQLAATYLDVRSKQGKIQACQEINLLQNESQGKISPLYAIYVPLNDLKKIWGYGAPIWQYSVDDVCDGKLELKFLIQQASSSKYKNVDELLTMIRLKLVGIQNVYESNSLAVWIVPLPVQINQLSKDGSTFERDNYQQLWLLTRSSQGFTANYLDDVYQGSSTVLSVDYLQIIQDDLIIMIQANDSNFRRIFVSRVAPNGEIQTLLYDFYVDGFIVHSTKEIAIVAESYYQDQPDITYYKWNPELQKLDERKINFDFVKAQDEAEKLVFQDRNFSQAILYINKFLVQAPPEPKLESSCIYSRCDYYPEWYRPYMRYLLAMVYEMSGEVDQARDAYFALWQDYPTNVFGLSASHRLVLAPSK